MTDTITRVFHMVHPTGQVFSLQDSMAGTLEPYSLQSKVNVDISRQIPSMCTECGFKAGIRNLVKVGELTNRYGHLVEFYVAIVNADNNTRSRPTINKYSGKWVHPSTMEDGATEEVKTWINAIKELKSWTLSDIVQYKVGL